MSTPGLSLTPSDLQQSTGQRRKEVAIRWAFLATGIVSIAISILIVVSLVGKAASFLSQIQLSWLLSKNWNPRSNEFSIEALFVASFIVAGIAILVAAPLGLGAAIYLSEYATPRIRRRLKPIVELLAGVPSIVVAYFALKVISPELVQRLFASAGLFSLAAAGIGVGILTIPLVATISEDALHAVPAAMREASFGLGARRKATSIRIVVPAAVSGIVAAMIVGLSRAIGETMVVAIVAGGVGSSTLTFNPLEHGNTATGAMAALATGTDSVAGSNAAFPSLFFVGLLLFVLTLTLNVVSERFVRRYRRQY